jgi:hypothetical protein
MCLCELNHCHFLTFVLGISIIANVTTKALWKSDVFQL